MIITLRSGEIIPELILKGVVLAATGHRPGRLGGDYDMVSLRARHIRIELMRLIKSYKPDFMISGMALGIDTLWAQLALHAKIPLIAAIPFAQQDYKWSQPARDHYHKLLSQAYAVVNVSGELTYNPQFMQLRNEWMVDNCTTLVAVFDGRQRGGTYRCVEYARQVEREMIVIDPSKLRMII